MKFKVLHPAGYTQIFALYFEHEGRKLPVDKPGNTKLDRIKAWCEKKALRDGIKSHCCNPKKGNPFGSP